MWRAGGGVIVYVRDSFSCRRRHDLEIRGLESVWVEILVKSKKILIRGFYRPPNSNNEYFNLISESVDRAHNTNVADIIITGDFNINMKPNNNKMAELIKQYNLKQLINEPTHYTENSASLIDLILVRNRSNILTSDCFLPNQTRYHCPVLTLLKFVRPSIKTFKRKVWNYHQTLIDIAPYYRKVILKKCGIIIKQTLIDIAPYYRKVILKTKLSVIQT